jgi:3-phosphoshikimate 1-carboxyvinyltransferase
MKVSIFRGNARGEVTSPPSKSYTIRSLMCASLAKGESEIILPLQSDDSIASREVLKKIGVEIQEETGLWRVQGNNFRQPEEELYCGDSAATLRFMTAICSLIKGECRLTTGASLAKRPIKPLVEALKQVGVDCEYQIVSKRIIVRGGKIRGGTVLLPGNISSQFISALLFVSPFAERRLDIKLTTAVESKPYILMTLKCMEDFGVKAQQSADLRELKIVKQDYKPTKYRVEGDWSSASYFLALGALAGEVRVVNLNSKSLQADKAILDFLREMGATVQIEDEGVSVKKSRLIAIKADLSNCIDLLPTLAMLAAVADGTSEFSGVERARLKESDRVQTVKTGLEAMGISVKERKDTLTITGGNPKGTLVDPAKDHRMAMAFALLGSISDGVVIQDGECVSKTYPAFWEELKKIGLRTKEE